MQGCRKPLMILPPPIVKYFFSKSLVQIMIRQFLHA